MSVVGEFNAPLNVHALIKLLDKDGEPSGQAVLAVHAPLKAAAVQTETPAPRPLACLAHFAAVEFAMGLVFTGLVYVSGYLFLIFVAICLGARIPYSPLPPLSACL